MSQNAFYQSVLKVKEILEDKLIDHSNNRILTSFILPPALGGGSFGVTSPRYNFYYQIIIFLFLQMFVAALLALPLYYFTIVPQKEKKISMEDTSKSLIVGLGIIFPLILYEPVLAIKYFDIDNLGIRMLLLSLPITGSLRCIEALAGNTPPGAKKNIRSFILYFSCLMGLSYNEKEQNPFRVSGKHLIIRITKLIRDYIIIIPLLSFLKVNNYVVFKTGFEVDSTNHTFWDLLSWKHLLNNYMNALLLSVSLSQSTSGVSIIYSISFGYETIETVQNPMLKSKSPSNFWGRRWNNLVHGLLKSSTFKPVRKYYSRTSAVLATFFVSGLLHEYVNLILLADIRDSVQWKQMLFFLWNGLILFLESVVGDWMIFQWVGKNLPKPVITALVILTALPLGHLFLGEYIRGGYFDHISLCIPMIVKNN